MQFANPLIALYLVGLLSGCASWSTAPIDAAAQNFPSTFATPPFYRIEGDGGAILLVLGTIHLGPTDGWQFSPEILDGLERADRFVLEVDLREATEDLISTILEQSVVIAPPNTLLDLVSPETAQLLDENDVILAKMGLPRNARKRLKPWYIAMGLIESASLHSGFLSSASADNAILEASGTRPLIGLETIHGQLAMLNELSARNQDVLLRDTLSRLDTAVETTGMLVEAWRSGDEARLAAISRDGVEDLPQLDEFYDVILDDRTRSWMPSLQAFLDEPDHAGEIIFVGVGALHLIGEGGLVELFEKAGYRAERIEQSGPRGPES